MVQGAVVVTVFVTIPPGRCLIGVVFIPAARAAPMAIPMIRATITMSATTEGRADQGEAGGVDEPDVVLILSERVPAQVVMSTEPLQRRSRFAGT